LGDSSATCVPVDNLNAEGITVPIERLTRVPPGVPEIATLPKVCLLKWDSTKMEEGDKMGENAMEKCGKEQDG
jgi:hypothetical protein